MLDPRMSDVCGLYSEDGICYRGYRCLQVLGYIYVYIVVLDMTHDFLYDFEAHGLTAPGGCIVICFTFFMLATCMTHSILIYADPGFIQPALLSNIRVKDQLDTCGACDYGRWKPYRALHCPSCRACVFQASDHNSGFGKCIGWGNRKIYCQYLACLSVSMGISAGVSVVALISMNLSLLRIFAIALILYYVEKIPLGAKEQMHFLRKNQTNLERLHKLHGPSKTCKDQFYEQFGEKWWQWFLPIGNSNIPKYEEHLFGVDTFTQTYGKATRRFF